MDPVVLVKEQVDDGRRLVNWLREHGVPVSAAFWNQYDDGQRWVFWIVSPLVDQSSSSAVYGPVVKAMTEFRPDFTLGAFDVKAVGEKDQLAADVLRLQKNHPKRYGLDAPPFAISGATLWGRLPQPVVVVPLYTGTPAPAG
jgi:hypothetical protein